MIGRIIPFAPIPVDAMVWGAGKSRKRLMPVAQLVSACHVVTVRSSRNAVTEFASELRVRVPAQDHVQAEPDGVRVVVVQVISVVEVVLQAQAECLQRTPDDQRRQPRSRGRSPPRAPADHHAEAGHGFVAPPQGDMATVDGGSRFFTRGVRPNCQVGTTNGRRPPPVRFRFHPRC